VSTFASPGGTARPGPSPSAAAPRPDDPSRPIPLVDLRLQHAQVAGEVEAGWARVLADTAYVLGAEVAAFEREFAGYCGARHCVGVANGTDALELALRAAGVGAGDEVILPANTFIASAEAVLRAGARVVLADCDPSYLLIDPAAVKDALTPRTRAVMAVHLYGQVAPVDELAAIGEAGGVALIEDAAQAQGARRHGAAAGSLGLAAGTSFYPGKNLGAYGDAGAVLTGDDDVARRVRALRNHGSEVKYEHPELGFNSRLDTLQAVVLRAKLARLEAWNADRRAAADRYTELLGGCEPVTLPATMPGNVHAWHLYVVQVDDRDRVLAALNAAGIGAGIHYPVPIHLQGALAHLGHRRGDFPVAEAAAGRILSLPMYPGITAGQQERIADTLRKAVGC
jgi:dTDP-4-amino-4,6-dideoxygalactose transaminase